MAVKKKSSEELKGLVVILFAIFTLYIFIAFIAERFFIGLNYYSDF